MPLRLGCQNCGRLLSIKDELAGKRIKCPHCGTAQKVPLAAPAEEEAPPSPPEPPVSREEALQMAGEYSAAKALRRKRLLVILAFALPGLIYGLASAYMNQNPYYAWFRPTSTSLSRLEEAWQWRPSPVWVPSYLLTQAGIGMQYQKAPGYHFRSFFDWLVFYVASALLGAAPLAGLGALAALTIKKKPPRDGGPAA